MNVLSSLTALANSTSLTLHTIFGRKPTACKELSIDRISHIFHPTEKLIFACMSPLKIMTNKIYLANSGMS